MGVKVVFLLVFCQGYLWKRTTGYFMEKKEVLIDVILYFRTYPLLRMEKCPLLDSLDSKTSVQYLDKSLMKK